MVPTAWKVTKHGIFSGPYFPALGPEKNQYLDTFHAISLPLDYNYVITTKLWGEFEFKDVKSRLLKRLVPRKFLKLLLFFIDFEKVFAERL